MFNFMKNKVVKEREQQEKGIAKVIYRISLKCAYGSNMEELNEAEKVMYCNFAFKTEIDNGGFSMLFFQPVGIFAFDMVDSLKAIGAVKCAQLLDEAIQKFPPELKGADIEKRRDMLEVIDPEDNLFLELDEALGSMGEDINVYQTAYMIKHREELGVK